MQAALDDGSWAQYRGRHDEHLVRSLAALHENREFRLCATGTVAVELALRGLLVGSGDEVVVAAYDFAGNFRAITTVGATPVLIDIEPSSYSLDASLLAEVVSEKTRAIVVSHLHGGLADMPAIRGFADEHGIAVVEDACQAPGAMVAGRRAGCWGDVGVLSFGGSKLLSAGRGGAIHSAHAEVMQRIRIYSEQGNDAYAMSELQAAVLLPQVEQLDERNRRRAKAAQRLATLFKKEDWMSTLDGRARGEPAYYKFVLRPTAKLSSVDRETLIAALRAEGIEVGPGFRGFLNRSSRRCRKPTELPRAELAAQETILLHHPILLEDEPTIALLAETLDEVCAALSI
ncbi:MAG: aminotransferase class V-fold PLP-dependent enzyme [Planctomycetales bacterium]|nr:aminotransferase class V-fold PLP-dependent enzyme [Planctomycetales bacterium]